MIYLSSTSSLHDIRPGWAELLSMGKLLKSSGESFCPIIVHAYLISDMIDIGFRPKMANLSSALLLDTAYHQSFVGEMKAFPSTGIIIA